MKYCPEFQVRVLREQPKHLLYTLLHSRGTKEQDVQDFRVRVPPSPSRDFQKHPALTQNTNPLSSLALRDEEYPGHRGLAAVSHRGLVWDVPA